MGKKILSHEFFTRSAVDVAEDLLGKCLIRKIGKKTGVYTITETEAYEGPYDKASHASRGRTARTEVMFGPPGHFYVYLCYGMHWMLNIVTGPIGHPAAVLIRATRSSTVNISIRTRGVLILDGPGKLTKALKIDKGLNALCASPKAGLWFEDRGIKMSKNQIKKTPRIGVSYAGPVWSKKKYRFILKKLPKEELSSFPAG